MEVVDDMYAGQIKRVGRMSGEAAAFPEYEVISR